MKQVSQIGVIGSGFLDDEDIYKIAYEIGKQIAKNKLILICGGKGGVMEAVCKGVNDSNGISVGILPSINKAEANKYVTIKIPTNLGENRNYLVVQSSEVVICIAGKEGTRMEAEYTLKLKKPLITIPKTGGTSLAITKEYPESVIPAETSEEAVQKLLELVNSY